MLVGNFLKDHVIPRSATAAAAVIWKMKHNERMDETVVIDRAIHCMDNAFCLWAHINALLLLSKICFIKTAAVATIILDAAVVVTVWFSTNFVQSSRDAEANVPHAQKLSRIKTFLTAIFRLIHDTITATATITKCQVLFGG